MSNIYHQFQVDAPRIDTYYNTIKIYSADDLYHILDNINKNNNHYDIERLLYYFTQNCLSEQYIDYITDHRFQTDEHLLSNGAHVVHLNERFISVTKEFHHVYLHGGDEIFIIDIIKCKIIYDIYDKEEYDPEWSSLLNLSMDDSYILDKPFQSLIS